MHIYLRIAPNANSSIICGTSPSIEPMKQMHTRIEPRAGSHLVKNKYLEEELEKVGKNTDKVWNDIITNGGSVQHLSFLSQQVKHVFKTIELDQNIVNTGWRQTKISVSRTIESIPSSCWCNKEVFASSTFQCLETRLKVFII